MENFPYPSYPDSGNSSPRSREIEFDNQPWDEQQQPPPNYKAKFMCSYGGKIHPRPHDNLLSYIGGETKILAVDRNIKFSTMIAKLATLCGDADVAFKYQLPGEELDALISVTNDDDLDHMMHEHDRLYRSSAKPARMRLFVFPATTVNTDSGSFGPGQAEAAEHDRFVEALNSAPARELPKPAPGNADFLFGLEKGVSPPPPQRAAALPDPVGPVTVAHEPQIGLGRDDRVFGSDHGVSHAEIQRQLQELQRLQISGHGQEAVYRRKSEEASMGGFGGGAENYVQRMPEKLNPATIPSSVPTSAPAGYWPDKPIHGGAFAGAVMAPPAPPEQPLYAIHGHSGLYHAQPVARAAVMGQPGHGYYAVPQRVVPDTYRDQPVFNVAPPQQPPLPMAAPPALPPQQQQQQQQLHKVATAVSTEGIVTGRPNSGVAEHIAYAQVAYDGATGRQVFYTAAGGVVAAPPPPQYQGVAAAAPDMRTAGQVVGPDGKLIAKVTQPSV